MQDLTIVRRTKNIGSTIGHGLPVMRLDTHGRFIFTKAASQLLKLKKDDGLMFGFNYKNQKYIRYEKFHIPDSYTPSIFICCFRSICHPHFNTCR